MFRVALILLLCLAAPAVGWDSLHAMHSDAQNMELAVPRITSAQSSDRQLSIIAVADHGDADCDDDGCQDGHCKHGCACGCDMGTCASSSAALLGQPWTLPLIAATDAIAPLIAQPPAATRGTSPLRPPIA